MSEIDDGEKLLICEDLNEHVEAGDESFEGGQCTWGVQCTVHGGLVKEMWKVT